LDWASLCVSPFFCDIDGGFALPSPTSALSLSPVISKPACSGFFPELLLQFLDTGLLIGNVDDRTGNYVFQCWPGAFANANRAIVGSLASRRGRRPCRQAVVLAAVDEEATVRKILLVLGVLLIAVLLISSAKDVTLYGYISCFVQSANGATESRQQSSDKCLAARGTIVLVTDDDHQIVPIDNPDAVYAHYAHRVALYGYMKGDVFHVVSVRIL